MAPKQGLKAGHGGFLGSPLGQDVGLKGPGILGASDIK